MHDRSAKFKIGFASTASRLYEFEPNGAASAIYFRLRRYGDPLRGPRPARDFKLNNRFYHVKNGGRLSRRIDGRSVEERQAKPLMKSGPSARGYKLRIPWRSLTGACQEN
jgi:hypothetical protein